MDTFKNEQNELGVLNSNNSEKFRTKKIDFLIPLYLVWVSNPNIFPQEVNVSHYGVYHDWSSFDSQHRHTRPPGRPCSRRTTPNISGGVLHLELSHRSLLSGFEISASISSPFIQCSF